MCYSENVSLFTFIVGVMGSFLCYKKDDPNYKIIGVFFGFVILMQLLEYLLWKHQNCDTYNKSLSVIAMLINHLQPVVLFLAIFLINKNLIYKKEMVVMLFVYLCFVIPYSIQFLKGDLCTIKGQGNHLSWTWNKLNYAKIVYIVFLISFIVFGLLGFPNKSQGKLFSIISVVSFLISYFIYKDVQSVGSMWCFFAAFAPIFYIFLNKKVV